MSAFERMEEKVLMQEAKSQAVSELVSTDLNSQFARLESSSDIDDELAMLIEGSKQKTLPPAQPSTTTPAPPTSTAKAIQPVDAELEALRKQLDNL
jgi:phage shock protein A